MPKSRIRRKGDYTPPPSRRPVKVGSPAWLVPVMVGLFLLGLAWIIVYYVSGARYPVPGVEHVNLFIGFGLILVGFVLATRWK